MALRKITAENYALQLRCLDPSNDLLARLLSLQCLEDTIYHIKQLSTIDQKCSTLLDALIQVPSDLQESVLEGFVKCLRESGQDHVANIYRKESDKVPMSDDHYDKLTQHFDRLCQFTEPGNILIRKLFSMKVINCADKEYIRSKSGYNEMSQKLIEILMRKADDAYDSFIDALNATNQSHVTFILTGEGDSRPLKDEHKIRLLTKRDKLVKMMDSKYSGLVTSLMSKGVFSSYDEERVKATEINDERNEIILNLVARKSQAAFFSFISALNDNNQPDVVMELIGRNTIAKIKTNYETGNLSETVGPPNVDAELVTYMQEMFMNNGVVVAGMNEILKDIGVSVADVRVGCIEITFTCQCAGSVRNLQRLYENGELEVRMNEAFLPKFADKGLASLKVEIAEHQFEQFMPMTSEHREALKESTELLVDKLDVSADLLDNMDNLCRRRREAIETAETREQQVKTLIDVVSRQPDFAFAKLLNALSVTNQSEVVELIKHRSRSVLSMLLYFCVISYDLSAFCLSVHF